MSPIATQADELTNRADLLLNEKQAARYLGFSPRALQNWRLRGGGPRFVKVSSRAVQYRLSDLLEWVERRLHKNTTQSGLRQ